MHEKVQQKMVEKLHGMGFEILGDYNGAKNICNFRCIANGHVFREKAGNVLYRGHAHCWECVQEELEHIAAIKSGKILSNYGGGPGRREVKVDCECLGGHRFSLSAEDILNGKWCDGGSDRTLINKIKSVEWEGGFWCITDYCLIHNIKTTLDWMCPNGHTFEASWWDFKQTRGDANRIIYHSKPWDLCPVCKTVHNVQRYKKAAEKVGLTCLSTTYSPGDYLHISCNKCNRDFMTRPDRVLRSQRCCPYCMQSKYESRTRYYFESVFKRAFRIDYPEWLINPRTGYRLQLDGYCEELKIAFEYQGKQHYTAVEFPNGITDTEYQQYRDRLKKELCEKNGVTLITVPFTAVDDNLLLYIIDECKKSGLIATRGRE